MNAKELACILKGKHLFPGTKVRLKSSCPDSVERDEEVRARYKSDEAEVVECSCKDSIFGRGRIVVKWSNGETQYRERDEFRYQCRLTTGYPRCGRVQQ